MRKSWIRSGNTLLLFFSSFTLTACLQPKPALTQSSYTTPRDFKHTLDLGHKASRAVLSEDGLICAYSSRDLLYQWVSPNTGEILHEVKDKRLLGGQFALHKHQIYTTYYNRVFRIDPDGTSVQLLEQFDDEFAGIRDLSISNGMLFVKAHRGLFVFSMDDLSLLHAFRHSNVTGVGKIGYFLNADAGILYVSNLKDSTSGSTRTVAVKVRDNFNPLWETRLAGEHPDIRSNNQLNIIHESASNLVVPHLEGSKSQISFLDKTNGEVINTITIHTNQAFVYGQDHVYIKELAPGQMAAVAYADQAISWTSPLPADCQGNFYWVKDRLLASCTGKRTQSIDVQTGEPLNLNLALAIKAVWTPESKHSHSFFLLGSQLCWDD